MSELATSNRILLASSLYPSILPPAAGVIIKAIMNECTGIVTVHLCSTETGLSYADCWQALQKFIANGMVVVERAADPKDLTGLTLMRLAPFVELSVTTDGKKRKRHAPKVKDMTDLERWLDSNTGKVTVSPPS